MRVVIELSPATGDEEYRGHGAKPKIEILRDGERIRLVARTYIRKKKYKKKIIGSQATTLQLYRYYNYYLLL